MAQPESSLPKSTAGPATSGEPVAGSVAIRSSRRRPNSQAPAALRPTPAPQAVVYRAAGVSRARFLRAYFTTWVVIFSYIALSLRARFMGKAWRDQAIVLLHKKNARRVYATILRLQGLFIKVGQLLSIMANFL